jgi:hypothetical protein
MRRRCESPIAAMAIAQRTSVAGSGTTAAAKASPRNW